MSKSGPLYENALKRGVQALAHRGPDAETTWISPNARMGLGHRRLSVIDIEGGAQPIHSEDGSICAVVNGEFYGYEDIRKELFARGHRFHTQSDSEILVHLYEEEGTQCLERLRGEFAFILWDERTHTLFAARDRFGIKPLFYAQHGDTVYLASEVKALFAAGVPAAWDKENLVCQMFAFLTGEQTLYRGVLQVPPGHYVQFRNESSHLTRYWDLSFPQDNSSASEADLIEELRWRLGEAVNLRLRADVPVCAFLSGGIDSSTIFHLAAHQGPKDFRAFTIAFTDDESFNEAAIARESAMRAGVDLEIVPIGAKEIADDFGDSVWHAETLGLNWHGVARFHLCRQIRRSGYKVALTGEGADELFAGYAQFRSDVMDGVDSRSPAWVDRLRVSRSALWLLLNATETHRTPESVYEQFLDRLDCRDQLDGRTPLRQSLYRWARSILPNYTLAAERLEMAHGVECRVPFLDHHLFEFARSIPGELMICDGIEKYILRQAARPFVIERVFHQPKHPFFSPPAASCHNGPLNELIQDTLRSDMLASFPILDRTSIRSLADALPSMPAAARAALDPTLLILISAATLQERLHLSW